MNSMLLRLNETQFLDLLRSGLVWASRLESAEQYDQDIKGLYLCEFPGKYSFSEAGEVFPVLVDELLLVSCSTPESTESARATWSIRGERWLPFRFSGSDSSNYAPVILSTDPVQDEASLDSDSRSVESPNVIDSIAGDELLNEQVDVVNSREHTLPAESSSLSFADESPPKVPDSGLDLKTLSPTTQASEGYAAEAMMSVQQPLASAVSAGEEATPPKSKKPGTRTKSSEAKSKKRKDSSASAASDQQLHPEGGSPLFEQPKND